MSYNDGLKMCGIEVGIAGNGYAISFLLENAEMQYSERMVAKSINELLTIIKNRLEKEDLL